MLQITEIYPLPNNFWMVEMENGNTVDIPEKWFHLPEGEYKISPDEAEVYFVNELNSKITFVYRDIETKEIKLHTFDILKEANELYVEKFPEEFEPDEFHEEDYDDNY